MVGIKFTLSMKIPQLHMYQNITITSLPKNCKTNIVFSMLRSPRRVYRSRMQKSTRNMHRGGFRCKGEGSKVFDKKSMFFY